MNDILSQIKKAQIEAIKLGIRANAVIISDEFHYIKEFAVREPGGYAHLVPPQLCGMRLCIDTQGELPEEYAFSIIDSCSPETSEDSIRRKVLQELRGYSIDELIKEVYGVDLNEDQSDLG